MIIEQEKVWGVRIYDDKGKDEAVCLKCLKEEEVEGKNLDDFLYEGSAQFNGTLTPAFMFCDRCHTYMKCSWAFIDRKIEEMKTQNDAQERRNEVMRLMIEALIKDGYSINQIQDVMSIPHLINFKNGHIEVTEGQTEDGDIPF